MSNLIFNPVKGPASGLKQEILTKVNEITTLTKDNNAQKNSFMSWQQKNVTSYYKIISKASVSDTKICESISKI